MGEEKNMHKHFMRLKRWLFALSSKAKGFDYANISPKLSVGWKWRWKKKNRHWKQMDKTEKEQETRRSRDQGTLSPRIF